jgi:hypothetical protein
MSPGNASRAYKLLMQISWIILAFVALPLNVNAQDNNGDGKPEVVQVKVFSRGKPVVLQHRKKKPQKGDETVVRSNGQKTETRLGGILPILGAVDASVGGTLDGYPGWIVTSINPSAKGGGVDVTLVYAGEGAEEVATGEKASNATATTGLRLVGQVDISVEPVKVTVKVRDVLYTTPTVDNQSDDGQATLTELKNELCKVGAQLIGSQVALTDAQRNRLMLDGKPVDVDIRFVFFEESKTATISLSTKLNSELTDDQLKKYQKATCTLGIDRP